MGILDGNPFDQQASEAATPGWLGRALASPGIGAGQAVANAAAGLTPASPPAAAAHAGNPFAALLGGPAAALSRAGAASVDDPGLGARATAAVMNFLNGHGVLPAIGGAIAGATTGQRTDPAGLMQARAAATMRALLAAGVAPDVAQAAAVSPDIMRLIAPQLAAAPQRRSDAAPYPPQFDSTGKTREG